VEELYKVPFDKGIDLGLNEVKELGVHLLHKFYQKV
jgi:hypothetical protein